MSDSGQPNNPIKQQDTCSPGIASGEPRDAAGFLLRALKSQDPAAKRSFAEQGLRALEREKDDEENDELVALLLRQVYLADIEEGHDTEALHTALEMIDLGQLGDIARQDAARAALGVRDVRAAIGHLQVAARVCPPERRAFHFGHLGSLLRFDGQTAAAIDAFDDALRWTTKNRNLYQAQLTLAQAADIRIEGNFPQNEDFLTLRCQLENEGPRHGYALWILGELCLRLGDQEAGKSYLKEFLSRQAEAPRAKSIALCEEIAHATALLNELSA